MSKVVICPKAGECDFCKDSSPVRHDIPHELRESCIDITFQGNCPACVPVKPEVKSGGAIRINPLLVYPD